MKPTKLPIPNYDPSTICFDDPEPPLGDPYVDTCGDGRLNMEHYQRVLAARDEVEARTVTSRNTRHDKATGVKTL